MKTVCVLQHTEAEYLGLMEDHFEGRNIRFVYKRPFTAGGTIPSGEEGFDSEVLLRLDGELAQPWRRRVLKRWFAQRLLAGVPCQAVDDLHKRGHRFGSASERGRGALGGHPPH